LNEFKADNLMELDELKAVMKARNETRRLAELEERVTRR